MDSVKNQDHNSSGSSSGVSDHEAQVVINELKNLKSHRDVYRRRGGVLLHVDNTSQLIQEFGGMALQHETK